MKSDASITVVVGDIVQQADCDAIVNSANERLRAGSGDCGAIHRAAGPDLEVHAVRLAPLSVSEAVITPGFNLTNSQIIHVAGAEYHFHPSPEDALGTAMRNVIALVDQNVINELPRHTRHIHSNLASVCPLFGKHKGIKIIQYDHSRIASDDIPLKASL